MPIIEVRSLPVPAHLDRGAILLRLVSGLSEAIETPATRVFASWQIIELQADGLELRTAFALESHPPLVRIDLLEGRSMEAKGRAVTVVAEILKKALGMEGNPFVHLHDIHRGQVHTGGQLIEVH